MLYYFLPQKFTRPVLVGVASAYILVDLLRLYNTRFRLLFMALFGRFLKQRERKVLNAGSYLFISSLFAVFLLRKEIAVCALSFAILGDTGAALVGMSFGRHRLGRKSLEGAFACLCICLAIAFLIPHLPLLARLLGPVAATLTELLPKGLDDNLVVPIVGGGVMEILG